MARKREADLTNRLVNFRIRDVYYPDFRELMDRLYGDNLLQGTVLDYTAGSPGDSPYVVVQVDGFPEPVVVSTGAILEVL